MLRRDRAQRSRQDHAHQDPDRTREARSGRLKLGHKVQVGYHDQGLRSLDAETTVVRAVWPEDDPEWVENDVRNLLARFGLRGELAFQTVGQLSGGEKAKAALARLCATSANLLVMDEPTNHLDIWSQRSARAIDQRIRGDGAGREPRPIFSQSGRRPVGRDGRRRARLIEGDYDTYQHMIQKEKERGSKSPRSRRRSPPRPGRRRRARRTTSGA